MKSFPSLSDEVASRLMLSTISWFLTYQKIADLLAMPGIEEIDLEIPHLRDLAQPADLS